MAALWPCHWPLHWAGSDRAMPRLEQTPGMGISSHILTFENNHFWGGGWILLLGVCASLLAKSEWALLHPPLDASGLAPSTCSDSEKEVTGTCRQEPLTYIKKVYSRESVYISINISCIYINKYIKKNKECIILMQHKAVLRESLKIGALQSRIYWSGQKEKIFCLFYIFTVLF